MHNYLYQYMPHLHNQTAAKIKNNEVKSLIKSIIHKINFLLALPIEIKQKLNFNIIMNTIENDENTSLHSIK